MRQRFGSLSSFVSASHASLIVLLIAMLVGLGLFAPASVYGQWVTGTVSVGGQPQGMAVNPVTDKIYVGVSGTSVIVIDGATNSTTRVTPYGMGAYNIAVNQVTNKVYVADYGANNVTVIDGATNNVVTSINVGNFPDALAVDPVMNFIYVCNNADGTVSVIDGASNTVTATVAVGGYPSSLTVNPVTHKVYVTTTYGDNATPGTLVVIDGMTASISMIGVGLNPFAVAVNPVTNRAYVTNSSANTVSVIDGALNRVIATVSTGSYPDNVAVNPVTNKIYVADSADGTVTIIDGVTNNTTTVSTTGTQLEAIAVNSLTNKVYLSDFGGSVWVLDGANNSFVSVNAANELWALAINPVTDKIYVGGWTGSGVTVIDGSVNGTTTIPTGADPEGLAANPATGKIYVSNDSTTGGLTVINEANNSTSQIATGQYAYAVAVNPVTNKIYVPNYGSNNVTVIDGATQIATSVPADRGPDAVGVNPVTNKIYVPNWNSADVTVIDGVTNSTTTVAAGAQPYAVAVNPTNNKAYVTNVTAGTVTVIDGSNNATTVPVGNTPTELAVNPRTNQVYVVNEASASVSVIDGATNSVSTISVGSVPVAVAVNPLTNKIYVANEGDGTMTVIDGVTRSTTTLPLATIPFEIAVNAATNEIYVTSNLSNVITIIDGATNAVNTLTAGTAPWRLTVDPVTGKVFIGNVSDSTVRVITPTAIQSVPLTAKVQGVSDSQTIAGTAIFTTYNTSPSFTASASSSYSPAAPAPTALYYQMDTLQGPWRSATASSSAGANPAAYSFSLSSVPQGVHTVYAYATYDNEGAANGYGGNTGSSPEIGNITAYTFAAFLTSTTTTVTADVNPQTAGQTVALTVYVQPASGSGTPTGLVTFLDGTTMIAIMSLDGTGHAIFGTAQLAVGSHAITVLYGGDASFNASTSPVLTVTITPPVTLTSVTISPTTATIQINGTQPFAAFGHYSDGSTQNLTTAAAWSSSNPGVATVAIGLATAVASGSTNITASSGGFTSNVASVTVPAQNPAATPAFSPFPSNYTAPQTVKLSDATAGTTIIYTTDGSTPSATNGTTYTGPITLTATTTIKTIATGNGYGPSAIGIGTYTMQATAPAFSPFPSTYSPPQTVKLSDASGAAIYFTVDGSTPSAANGTLYTGPIQLTASTTIKAIAIGTGLNSSAVVTGTYTLQALTPSFSPFPSSYSPPQTVKLSDSTSGTTIMYTEDGTTPSATNGTAYTGPISLTAASTTIKAVAVGSGFASSAAATGTYTLQAMAPAFSPFPSTYSTPQNVKLSDSTSGATIMYTVDGSTPSATNGTAYTAPIAVTATTTIKAIAVGTGYNPSTVTTATYTITP